MKFSVRLITVFMALIMTGSLFAHDHFQENTLKGKNIAAESKLLDSHYQNTALRMGEIIGRYNLLKNSDIKTIPYQVDYSIGKDFIKMEKHSIKRSSYDKTKILSVIKKNIKIYTNGDKVFKIETNIYKKNYRTGLDNLVQLVDPTPTKGGTGDIVITQVKNGKIIINKKQLRDFRNTTAFPVRNDIKRNFLIGHMGIFTDYLVFIGETYDRNVRKNDNDINGFLKTALKQ